MRRSQVSSSLELHIQAPFLLPTLFLCSAARVGCPSGMCHSAVERGSAVESTSSQRPGFWGFRSATEALSELEDAFHKGHPLRWFPDVAGVMTMLESPEELPGEAFQNTDASRIWSWSLYLIGSQVTERHSGMGSSPSAICHLTPSNSQMAIWSHVKHFQG